MYPPDRTSSSPMPASPSATPAVPRVIAVASGKGGVGKTSVCVNLATALINAGQRTLLLDTDLGLAMRATGDAPEMIRSLGVSTHAQKILGLALSNGLVAVSGALIAQYQGFADVGMGIGMIVAGLASVIIGQALIGRLTVLRAASARSCPPVPVRRFRRRPLPRSAAACSAISSPAVPWPAIT